VAPASPAHGATATATRSSPPAEPRLPDPIRSIWDAAELRPIIEEAGGVFTDWDRSPAHDGGSAISTNAALAGGIRDLLRERR
jgi:hypothetical protein